MTFSLRSWTRGALAPSVLIFLAFAAGCSSDPKSGSRGGQPGPRGKPFTPMTGQEKFFAGQIRAEIHVGTEGMPEIGPGGGNRDDAPGGRRRGGNGRMRVAGGAGGMGGDVSGGMPFGEGGPPSREFGDGPGVRPRLGPMGGGRPVMIHLRFTNHTDAPVELRIPDFVSPLGNFAVRPEKLTIEPGQSLETEPMTSQLASSFTETVVTLVLRLGEKVEKKTFPLKAAPSRE